MKTIATLNNIRRGLNSRMGNPGWSIETDQGTFKLEANSGLGYAIDSPEYRELIGQRVTITHNKNMRFSNITPA